MLTNLDFEFVPIREIRVSHPCLSVSIRGWIVLQRPGYGLAQDSREPGGGPVSVGQLALRWYTNHRRSPQPPGCWLKGDQGLARRRRFAITDPACKSLGCSTEAARGRGLENNSRKCSAQA